LSRRLLLLHVPLSAWGVFGAGPWPDFGGELAARLAAAGAAPPPFVVACPKLTPEKGLGLVAQLARRLPDVAFVGVAATTTTTTTTTTTPEEEDDDGNSRNAPPPAPAMPPNLRLLRPGGSSTLDAALRGAALCLLPSLWREAYGMAAVDAALRGVPVAASRGCGGLTEAALLLLPGEGEGGEEAAEQEDAWPARLLPVEFVRVPADEGEGDARPPWARRAVPRAQPEAVVEAWASAVTAARDEFSASPAEFARRSAATRARAEALVARGEGELRRFLREVVRGGDGGGGGGRGG